MIAAESGTDWPIIIMAAPFAVWWMLSMFNAWTGRSDAHSQLNSPYSQAEAEWRERQAKDADRGRRRCYAAHGRSTMGRMMKDEGTEAKR